MPSEKLIEIWKRNGKSLEWIKNKIAEDQTGKIIEPSPIIHSFKQIRKPQHERHTIICCIRLSPQEKEMLTSLCEQRKTDTSKFFRDLIYKIHNKKEIMEWEDEKDEEY